MLKEVIYSRYVLQGIRPLKRDYPANRNLVVFGADTETCHGKPISLQIAGPEDAMFTYTNSDEIFSDFWRWVRGRCRPKGVNLCYFHNLSFDLRVLFIKQQLKMYEHNNDIKLEIEEPGLKVACRILFGKVFKADLVEGLVRLQLFDSRLFTQASLARSLKMFSIPQDKLKPPEGLGEVDFGRLPPGDVSRQAFELYSKQDALAERALGLKIMEFHEAYLVAPSLSLPSYSARVFRRHFLGMGDSIPFPPIEVVKASEKSYHGGKNGFYLDAPQVVEDVYELDISSAYPFAMKALPGIDKGRYCRVECYKDGYAGIYCLTGRAEKARGLYPLVFDHSFSPVRGDFENLWHTGHELKRMLALKWGVKLEPYYGYVWQPGEGSYNPFARFVDHFYGKKESTPKSDPYYHLYKIVLNALYGKLASTIEVKSADAEDEIKKLRLMGVDIPTCVRIDQRYDKLLGRYVHLVKSWRAGALYNPFLASQITGHARSYLYDLEKSHSSLHSATDSIKTTRPVAAVKGLGGLKIECYGRCYLFRNKLYLHFSKSYDHCQHDATHGGYPFRYPEKYLDGTLHPKAGQPLMDTDGQHLCKVGLHGYKGPLWFLFENRHKLIREGKLKYTYKHVVGLREGLRRGWTPCDFIDIEETLSLWKVETPDNIVKFCIKRGGFDYLRDIAFTGELNMFRAKDGGPRARGLVNLHGGGLTCDYMREACVEGGYLTEDATISDLFDAVDETLRGRPVYAKLAGGNYQPSGLDEIYPDELDLEVKI